jgi:hypothetical protein
MAVLCYLGALRVPVVAFMLPGWAFTLPTGLLSAGAVWLYGRRRNRPFLCYHGREGFRWALEANLLLAAIALLARGWYALWQVTGLDLFDGLWHFSATGFRWAGALVSIITAVVMYKAARGQTGDALGFTPRDPRPAAALPAGAAGASLPPRPDPPPAGPS